MQQREILILQQARQEHIQLLIHSRLVHVVIQQQHLLPLLLYQLLRLHMQWISLLCNRNCNGYTDRNCRWNVHCTCGVVINAATGDINLATSTPGTYTITYSFTVGACSNTATTSITITALPTATISYAGSPYCATGTATVTQTGTAGGTYTAPAGVSINAATGDIDLATSTPGTYTITYSFTVGACSNTATTSITITALPTATISYAGSPYCATGTATVTQTGTAGGTYTAPAGVVINAATGDINVATSTPGTYTITYSFTVGACSNTATTSITIAALPVATISYAGSPYCATGTATVTQTGTAGGTYTAPAGVSLLLRPEQLILLQAHLVHIPLHTASQLAHVVTLPQPVSQSLHFQSQQFLMQGLHIAQRAQLLLLRLELREEHIQHLQE